MKKKILFRVDSSSKIGSGHLHRCLNLALALRERNLEVEFISRNLKGNLTNLLRKNNIFIHELSKPPINKGIKNAHPSYESWLEVSQENDAEDSIRIISSENKPIVIIDHYAIDSCWHNKVKPFAYKLFVIDDLANRSHDCDYLLDQNIQPDKSKYEGLIRNDCICFLGPKYTLLSSLFLEQKNKINFDRAQDELSILVFFGSYDEHNETLKALKGIKNANLKNISVRVVVGAANIYQNQIKELCQRSGFKFICQSKNMAKEISLTNIAIGACGASVWERCYFGVPSIVTTLADNQIEVADLLNKQKSIHLIGHYSATTSGSYEDALFKLVSDKDYRRRISLNASRIVSYGTNYIADIIHGLSTDTT